MYKKKIELAFEKTEDFNVPEGKYLAEVMTVFELSEPFKDGSSSTLRIKWRILDPSFPFKEYVVGNKYPMSLAKHSALQILLKGWLDEKQFGELVGDGTMKLHLLEGLRADIEVAHMHTDHKNPFVYPKQVKAPGTLVPRNKGDHVTQT